MSTELTPPDTGRAWLILEQIVNHIARGKRPIERALATEGAAALALLRSPEPFTVTIAGPEHHDGEKPYPVQRREDTLSPDVVILGEPSPENPYDFQGAELPARAGQSAQQQQDELHP